MGAQPGNEPTLRQLNSDAHATYLHIPRRIFVFSRARYPTAFNPIAIANRGMNHKASLDFMAEAEAPLIVRSEILLSRAHFSPGEIDGQDGDNYRRALRAFQQKNKLPDTSKLDAATWSALTRDQTEPVLKHYTITAEDVAGPFEKRLSINLADMARLSGLSYSSPSAELAEIFHMGEDMLQKLNPGANFGRAGEQIVVAALSPMALRSTPHSIEALPPDAKASNGQGAEIIVVDKPARNVRAYDKDGKLLAFYPATIGSEEKPAPSGVFRVNRGRLGSELQIRSEVRLEGREYQTKAYNCARAEQSGRACLDRPQCSVVRHSRDASTGRYRKNGITWLRSLD